MKSSHPPIPWLENGQAFPNVNLTWDEATGAPGLLAAGGSLDVETLLRAYSSGIFPWYSGDQPVLWWSPTPRMVLDVADFKLHRSFKKTIEKFRANTACEIRIDSSFREVIQSCSASPRGGQSGTWIVNEMIEAYVALHQAGFAHSVETWVDGQLQGGLYCVSIGHYVFGESMFSRSSDSSKIALAALVAFCRRHEIAHIDCQQNTKHLNSLGAREIPRSEFLSQLQNHITRIPPDWKFDPLYWQQLIPSVT
ncbi:leucyl/phenylalanyl-tRNA--protein transferase [Rhodoferax sp. PAMC 29310]|uniref:leucyl/phenylalanyl-tRNA--protein transferase n=1 Tax=Rhodoferax sp. PAMC 29310 TaxID=2822760 RepID=UPI001B32C374|nr:leucyl/phenylalanyl-tRNA--protein transferase [Rhodoferax sp. PAMC 29310]